MAKITYLLGAGASVEALPIVSEIRLRLIIYKNYLIKYFSLQGIDDYINEIKEIIENITESSVAKPIIHCLILHGKEGRVQNIFYLVQKK